MSDNTVKTITFRGSAEGLDKITAQLNQLAAAEGNVAVVTEEVSKSFLSLEEKWKRQTLRIDEVARSMNNVARETKLADAALRQGILGDPQSAAAIAQHARQIELIQQRYGPAAKATQEFGKQTGLARHELINLGRQAQDVGVSLASGQSPFSVLVQQGTQIADVFATSGGTLRGFFTQAIGWARGFLATTGGMVTAVLAVGGAAIYAASQFMSSSKTTEQVLETQKQLLSESKALIEAKSAAEANLLATSNYKIQFEQLQNERDLREKINAEMQRTIALTEKLVTTPTGGGMPEMGIEPSGVAALKDPGYAQLTEAVNTLKAAWDNGQLGAREFNNEVARVGIEFQKANPAIAAVVELMLSFGKKVAGLEMVRLQAQEAAAAVARQGDAVRELIAIYPEVSVEVAKQLQMLDDQNRILKATGDEEKLIAEQIALQNRLRLEGKTTAEQTAILAKTRLNSEEKITNSYQTLAEQAGQQVGAVKETAQAAEKVDNQFEKMNVSSSALADLWSGMPQYFDAVGNRLDQFYRPTQNFADSVRDANDAAEDLAETTDGLIDKWGKLGSIAAAVAGRLDTLNAQFAETDEYVSSYDPLNISTQKRNLESRYGAGNVEEVIHGVGAGQFVSYRKKTEPSVFDTLDKSIGKLTNSTDSLNSTMQNALSPFYSQDPRTTKLGFRAGTVGNPDWMTGAGNANPLDAILGPGATAPLLPTTPAGAAAAAGGAMTPEQAYLAAIAWGSGGGWGKGFADGGSFVVGGGYSRTDNKMAMFPVASGEEVIVNRNRQQGGAPVVNIDNRIIIQGTVDTDTMAQLKISRYQQAQRMRAGMVA